MCAIANAGALSSFSAFLGRIMFEIIHCATPSLNVIVDNMKDKCNVGLKTVLELDISGPELDGDFVYKFRRIFINPSLNICIIYINERIDNYWLQWGWQGFISIPQWKNKIYHGCHKTYCMPYCKRKHGWWVIPPTLSVRRSVGLRSNEVPGQKIVGLCVLSVVSSRWLSALCYLRIESWFRSFNEGLNGITDAHIVWRA